MVIPTRGERRHNGRAVGVYTLRRLVSLVPTAVGVSVLVFLLMHLIPGTVVDQGDARIGDAHIRLTQIETNVVRTADSNSLGYYSFQLLPPARYRLFPMPGCGPSSS